MRYTLSYDPQKESFDMALCKINFDDPQYYNEKFGWIEVPIEDYEIANRRFDAVHVDEHLLHGQFVIQTYHKNPHDTIPTQPNKDVYYIVTLNEQGQDKLKGTTISYRFCAKLIQDSSKMIFGLNSPTKALVIIPFGWIESMAPSKVHWEEKNGKN